MESCWIDPLAECVKIERNLNFSTVQHEEDEYEFPKKKTSRDPISHRIIEKRRRDRMNNCLADLSRLIPSNYLKKGRGRIEKTEIIEMAIKHLKILQAQTKNLENHEISMDIMSEAHSSALMEQFSLGFHDCTTEVMRFLVEVEGYYAGEGLCVRLMNHLKTYWEEISKSHSLQNEEKTDITDCLKDISQDAYMSSIKLIKETELAANKMAILNCNNISSHQDSCSMDVQLGDCKSMEQKTSDYESEIGSNRWQAGSTDGSSSSNSSISSQYSSSLCNSSGSQLLKILQNRGVCSEQIQRQLSSPTDEVYKFKRNIKERFKADQQLNKMDLDFKNESEINCIVNLSNTETPSLVPRVGNVFKETHKQLKTIESLSSESQRSACIQIQNSEFSILKSGDKTSSSPYVPIFALHSSGTHYIPLSINSSYLDSLINQNATINHELPICHPVHIMVSFNNSCKVSETNCWKGHNNLNSSTFISSIAMDTNPHQNKMGYELPALNLSISKAQ